MDSDCISGCFLFIVLSVILMILGATLHDLLTDDYKLGYIQALADTENKGPLKYVRREQSNKEVIWVLNMEYKKDN